MGICITERRQMPAGYGQWHPPFSGRTRSMGLAVLIAFGLAACDGGPQQTEQDQQNVPEQTSQNSRDQDQIAATDDPYLWLETVEGEDALEWVRGKNETSLARLTDDPRYEPIRAAARSCLLHPTASPMAGSLAMKCGISGRMRPMCGASGGAPALKIIKATISNGKPLSIWMLWPKPKIRIGCGKGLIALPPILIAA